MGKIYIIIFLQEAVLESSQETVRLTEYECVGI